MCNQGIYAKKIPKNKKYDNLSLDELLQLKQTFHDFVSKSVSIIKQ